MLKLLKPFYNHFFTTSKSNSVRFSPFHRLKSLAHKVACPGVIHCFMPINEHLLSHDLGLLRHIHEHGQQHPRPGLTNRLCLRTSRACAAASTEHQGLLSTQWWAKLTGACWPPIFQVARLNTWDSFLVPVKLCEMQCFDCCSISKTLSFM